MPVTHTGRARAERLMTAVLGAILQGRQPLLGASQDGVFILNARFAMMFFWISVAPAPIDVYRCHE